MTALPTVSPAHRRAPLHAGAACLMVWALCGPAGAAEPLADGLLACRAMPDPASRLACYDRLPIPAVGASAAQAPASSPTERFGLELKIASTGAVDEIVSRLPGRFEGWSSGTRFKLANGQTWQVSDGSRAVFSAENPSVTIRRGAMGAFYLRVEGLNKEARVKRVE